MKDLARTARVTAVETTAERMGESDEIPCLAPAAAAALRLLADAVRRRSTGHDDVVQALKDAGVHEAFADVLDAACTVTTDDMQDPFDFDDRLHADNLSGAASDVRDVFRWL